MTSVLNLKRLVQNLYIDKSASDKDIMSSYYKIFWPILPFSFNGQEFHPCVGFERKFKLFLIFLYILQTIRLVTTSAQLYLASNFDHTYILVLLTTLSTTSASFFINAIYNGHQFCQTLNSWLGLRKGERTAFTETLQPLFIMACTFGFSIGLLFWKNPEKPIFLFSATGLHRNVHIFVLGIFLISEVWLQAYAFIGINLVMDALLVGIFQTVADNVEELIYIQKIDQTNILKYRTLKIYEIFINQGTNYIFTVIKLTSYLCITYGVVKAIMTIGESHLITDFIAALGFLFPITFRIKAFLCGMALFHTKSIAMLETWKTVIRLQTSDRKYMNKVLKSCKPLQYTINSVYGIKAQSVLSFASALVCDIGSVLIAFREDGGE